MNYMSRTLEWIATAVTLVGAFLTAQGSDPWNIYAMNLGSLLWLFWALRERLWSIAVVNLVMLSIYCWGLVSRITTI